MNTDNQTRLINLKDLTSLHVTGSDAAKFLHAQFTNDLANLPQKSWQYSGYCTAKGRLLSFMTIARLAENDFLLILPAEISEGILSRLRMFVMRDDVTLSTQDPSSGIAGILGTAFDLSSAGLTVAAETGELSAVNNSYLLTLDRTGGRYLYLSSQKDINQLSLAHSDRNDWTLHEILNGIPTVSGITQEAFVPQMVNLDLIGAVNFKKGCYPGQEVVARVHYLGKIKQRMFIAKTDSKQQVNPGEKVYIAGQPDSAVGSVVQAATNDSALLLQIVLKTVAVEEHADIRLTSADGEKLHLSTQPYPVLGDDEQA